MNVIEWATWLLGILFPVILLACAGKLVVVRTEIRLRDAKRARDRFAVWLRRSTVLLRREEAALATFRTAARGRNLKSPVGVLRGVAAGLSAILVLWIRMRAMPRNYMARECHARIERHISYLSAREEEYRAGLARDLADLKEALVTGVDWKRFFGNNRRLVFWGVFAMLASTTVATAFGWWLEAAGWLAVAGAVAIIAAALVGVVGIMSNSQAISYSWGCVFVLVIALTTIEFSPLQETWFEEAIDAQKVTTMFIGVGIVLTLSQLFEQRGMGPNVSHYERRVIKQSYRPAVPLGPIGVGLQGSSMATGGKDQRARKDKDWLQGERMEMSLVFVVLTLYGFSVGHFLSSTLQDANWATGQASQQDIGPIMPILAATICALALPLISLARATKARAFGSVVAVITALMVVAIAACGDVDDDTTGGEEHSDTVDIPGTSPQAGLSEDGRRVLERNVYFDFGSLGLTANAEEVLCLVSWVLSENDWLELTIVGHTDSVGPKWFNDNLGDQRASAVREFLVVNGVDSARIATESFGESRPRSMDRSEEDRARNRRVEFMIGDSRDDPHAVVVSQSGWFYGTPCHLRRSGDGAES